MAANDYSRTVSITPVGTAYAWDTPPSWITITQVGDTDEWTITVAANTTSSSRTAVLTVRHGNGTTTDTINVSQAGVTGSGSGAGATPTPVPTSTPTPVPTSTTSGAGAGATATPTPTPTSGKITSGGGSGTCYEINITNEGGQTIAGTLNGISLCGGGGVSLFLSPGSSTTICTANTANEVEVAINNLGYFGATVFSNGVLCF